jgi:hypothetical protein
MRKKTLLILPMLLSGAIMIPLILMARRHGIKFNPVMGIFFFVMVIPQLLLKPLTVLNRRLLAWRKVEDHGDVMNETSPDFYGSRQIWTVGSSLPKSSRLKLWLARCALLVSLGLYLAPIFTPDSVRPWIDLGGAVVLVAGLFSLHSLKNEVQEN